MANNQKTRRTVSLVEDAARDGSIFTVFTKTWGMHVRPWNGADKLKFDFVELDKGGKGNSFQVYMDSMKYTGVCFKEWADDILDPNRRFEQMMSYEEKMKNSGSPNAKQYIYPVHYKYVTGDNAEKSIGICNSSNGSGYCINASGTNATEQKVYCNIPINYAGLRILAENFNRAYDSRLVELEVIRAVLDIVRRTVGFQLFDDKNAALLDKVVDIIKDNAHLNVNEIVKIILDYLEKNGIRPQPQGSAPAYDSQPQYQAQYYQQPAPEPQVQAQPVQQAPVPQIQTPVQQVAPAAMPPMAEEEFALPFT